MPDKINETDDRSTRFVPFDLRSELRHGIAVSNLAYEVADRLGMPEDQRYELAVAGMVHDIGKLRLKGYIYGKLQDPMKVEELKYVRMHSQLGYEVLREQGCYSDFILESVLYHHENYDGSGYPGNLSGNAIPLGARILRVCDVYCALNSDRPYRKAFDSQTVMRMMIEEIKRFDLEIFLAFQRAVHDRTGVLG